MASSLFPDVDHDVVICGGGLAGLCLAKQLRDAVPGISVLVLERATTPLPSAAFKVGESTVEVGAYYLAEEVGLHDHIENHHLEKLGLRYFYPHSGGLPMEAEFGVTRFLPAKSYQLNRGTLEEALREDVRGAGAQLVEGVRVREIALGTDGEAHRVDYEPEGDGAGELRTVTSRWVVDAMGRRRFLQRKLGLAKEYPRRHAAAWFRLDGRLDVDAVVSSDHRDWHSRVEGPRWNSTNHFMFAGGWVWVIPLAPNHTSVGIVTAADVHPLTSFSNEAKAIDFVAERVPALEEGLRKLPVLDFLKLGRYSYSSRKVFSSQRWACVGEAGTFVDPYYSVGSNMIAYANGFVLEMVQDDLGDRLGEAFVQHANRYFLSLTEALTNNIQVAYPFYDRPVIMALKTIWDYYVGWAFSDPQYYQKTFLSLPASATISGLGSQTVSTQARIMDLFRDWSRRGSQRFEFRYIDYYDHLPTLAKLFVQNLPAAEPAPFHEVMKSIREGIERIEELALIIFYLAVEDVLPEQLDRVRAAGWLNASAISLDPERWARDGLFEPRSAPRSEQLARHEREIRALFREKAVAAA